MAQAYGEAVARAGAAALAVLGALEAAQRRLHPPDLPALRAGLAPLAARSREAGEALARIHAPPGLEAFHQQLAAGLGHAAEAARLFAEAGDPAGAVAQVLASLRRHCRAQEALYPLRQALPPLGRYFAEPAWHERLADLDPEPPAGIAVGVHAAGEPDARGGFHLYVPERYRGEREWPLLVALHGGFGHGRDFLWTWLREARCRGFLLLAPTSRGTTWSLQAPDVDAAALRSMIDYVAERWRVDRRRILLTGLSDGATYALLAGLAPGAPCTAVAALAGVLHPRTRLDQAAGRRIYLVHGALDWLFPPALARLGRDALARAGAELVYRELEDLSHTYPRDENARILAWFDPSLAEG